MRLEIDKLGGTSVGDMQQSGRVISENRQPGKALLVVTSTWSGVTSTLQNAIRIAVKRGVTEERSSKIPHLEEEPNIPDYWITLRDHAEQCHEHIRANVDPKEAEPLDKMVEKQTTEALGDFASMSRTKTLVPVLRDRHCALLGEGITGPILAAHLRCRGINAVHYEATRIMATDSNFGNANPIIDSIRARILRSDLISDLKIDGKVVVMDGYYGSDDDGRIATFSRGGSDRSATALGEALKRTFDPVAVYLYKADRDVAGVMSADPKFVRGVRVVDHMLYRETCTLGSIGGNIIHAKAVDHAIRGDFPLYVKSTMRPELPGTLIDGQISSDDPPIKVISVISNVIRLGVRGMGMDKAGIMGKIADYFAQKGIDIVFINQPARLELDLAYQYTGGEKGDKLERKLEEESKVIQQAIEEVLGEDKVTQDVDSVSANPASLIGIIGSGAVRSFNLGNILEGSNSGYFEALRKLDAYKIATGTYGVSVLIDPRGEDLIRRFMQVIHDSVFS